MNEESSTLVMHSARGPYKTPDENHERIQRDASVLRKIPFHGITRRVLGTIKDFRIRLTRLHCLFSHLDQQGRMVYAAWIVQKREGRDETWCKEPEAASFVGTVASTVAWWGLMLAKDRVFNHCRNSYTNRHRQHEPPVTLCGPSKKSHLS